ncbi:MAG: SAM-dependent methyltransferase [Halieaceae bacterium]|jgi:SAM-dependent methyltransferase
MSNEEQIAYWNGDAGRKWASRDQQMAGLLAPIAEALMDHAQIDGRKTVLDVGCGGGSETLLLAKRLGVGASILGADISTPLLEVASQRLAEAGDMGRQVRFLEADAASHPFGAGEFDLLFSRFGVMFFDDPTRAFTHLRSAMQPQGKLAFCCWQALRDNPWTAVPLKAALQVLPAPPPPTPRAPGPFAFAEEDYVASLLEVAGWRDIDIAPHRVSMRWGGEQGLAANVRELVNTGPVGRLLVAATDEQREAVYAAAEEVLAKYFDGEALSLSGGVWMVTARNE